MVEPKGWLKEERETKQEREPGRGLEIEQKQRWERTEDYKHEHELVLRAALGLASCQKCLLKIAYLCESVSTHS